MIHPRSGLLPTDRRYVNPEPESYQLRRAMYRSITKEPKTAAALAESFDLDLVTAIDYLRIIENFGVIRHRADSLGVIRWHRIPDNKWEGPEPPF